MNRRKNPAWLRTVQVGPALLGLFFLSGCADLERDGSEVRSAEGEAEHAARSMSYFASPRLIGIASGVEPATDVGDWIVGNELVYGVTLEGPQVLRRWLIRVKVLSPPREHEAGRAPFRQTISTFLGDYRFESRALELEIATYDGAGVEQESGVYRVPADFLSYGLFPGVSLAVAQREDPPVSAAEELPKLLRQSEEAILRSTAAWLGLFSFAQANRSLGPIVDVVIAKPSILEIVLRGFRLAIDASADFSRSRRAAPFPDIPGEVFSLPFDVVVNDSPVLLGAVLVARSRAPIMPAAGIVGADAWHPEHRDRAVSIRLLSATLPRGPAEGTRSLTPAE